MTHNTKERLYRGIFALCLFFGAVFVANGQLQQSGGGGSVITFGSPQHIIADASSAVIGHTINDTGSTTAVTGNVAVTGTFFQTTQPVSGTIRTAPLTSCGVTIVESGITAIPASTTAVPNMGSASTCVDKIFFNNTLSSTAICDVTDVTGSVAYVSGFNIPANSNMLLPFGGIKFAGGVKWFCGTGTVKGAVLGYQ